MKGKLLYVVLTFILFIFFHFFNGNQIMRCTREASRLEKTFQAERNINNELKVEHDDLMSGRHIASLVPKEMEKFITKENADNVIFVQEPAQLKTPTYYAIIDLLTPKAEAITADQLD
jgi:cell division protein FtsL